MINLTCCAEEKLKITKTHFLFNRPRGSIIIGILPANKIIQPNIIF